MFDVSKCVDFVCQLCGKIIYLRVIKQKWVAYENNFAESE